MLGVLLTLSASCDSCRGVTVTDGVAGTEVVDGLGVGASDGVVAPLPFWSFSFFLPKAFERNFFTPMVGTHKGRLVVTAQQTGLTCRRFNWLLLTANQSETVQNVTADVPRHGIPFAGSPETPHPGIHLVSRSER